MFFFVRLSFHFSLMVQSMIRVIIIKFVLLFWYESFFFMALNWNEFSSYTKHTLEFGTDSARCMYKCILFYLIASIVQIACITRVWQCEITLWYMYLFEVQNQRKIGKILVFDDCAYKIVELAGNTRFVPLLFFKCWRDEIKHRRLSPLLFI